MKMQMQMPKMPKMDKLLNDKNVLYVVFVLAILNILGYLLVQNTEAVAFFLIVGFLTTYFSKNMIVVLLVAMVSTSVFTSTRGRFIKEGMKSKVSSEKSEEEKTKPTSPSEEKAKKVGKSMKAPVSEEEDDEEEEDTVEGLTTVSRNKTNKLDYAGTLAKAYDSLQTTVGEGGIAGLTDQTKTLLEQQESLMKNIKGMEPFIQTAEKFMSKLDLSSFDGISGILSKFSGKQE